MSNLIASYPLSKYSFENPDKVWIHITKKSLHLKLRKVEEELGYESYEDTASLAMEICVGTTCIRRIDAKEAVADAVINELPKEIKVVIRDMVVGLEFAENSKLRRLQITIESHADLVNLKTILGSNAHIFAINDAAESSLSQSQSADPRSRSKLRTVANIINSQPFSQSAFPATQQSSQRMGTSAFYSQQDPVEYSVVNSSMNGDRDFDTQSLHTIISKEVRRQVQDFGLQTASSQKETLLSASDDELKQLYSECMRDPMFKIFVSSNLVFCLNGIILTTVRKSVKYG